MTDEPNDIDALMAIVPLELSRQDLDQIIAYQRKQRALREQGVRTRKPKSEATIGLSELLAGIPKPAPSGPAMKRRF